MRARPITLKDANSFVKANHKHNGPVTGWKWGISLWEDGEMVGVGMAGRPNARALDSGSSAHIIEISRLCLRDEAPKNAASSLYGRLNRMAADGGYDMSVTYTLDSEKASSLRAAGFVRVARVTARSWNTPSRPRGETRKPEVRWRWARAFTDEGRALMAEWQAQLNLFAE